MELLKFDDIESLCSEVIDNYQRNVEKNDDYAVTIIALYGEMKKIIAEILMSYDFDIEYMELENERTDGYDKEFVFSIFDDMIYVEKAFSNGKYKSCLGESTDDFVYVLDNCCSKILQHIDTKNACEVSIADDCESDTPEKSEKNGFRVISVSGYQDDYVTRTYSSSQVIEKPELKKVIEFFQSL